MDEERHIWRNGQGRPVGRLQAPDGITATRTTRVVLATAHLDHDPAERLAQSMVGIDLTIEELDESHARTRPQIEALKRLIGAT